MMPPVVRVGRGKAGGRNSVMSVPWGTRLSVAWRDGNLTVLEHMLLFLFHC